MNMDFALYFQIPNNKSPHAFYIQTSYKYHLQLLQIPISPFQLLITCINSNIIRYQKYQWQAFHFQ